MFNISELPNLLDDGLKSLTSITPEIANVAGAVREVAMEGNAWLASHENMFAGHLNRLAVDPATVPTIAASPTAAVVTAAVVTNMAGAAPTTGNTNSVTNKTE